MVRKWIIVLALALLVWLGKSDVEAGYRGPFEGWIVDADTKEPVEGVVVSIEWERGHINSGSTHVDIAETLTDAKGHFYISSWWSFNPWKNLMTDALPTIFKSEYEPIIGGPWDALEAEWGMPKGTYIWKTQKGKPVLLLRRATADIEKRRNMLGRVDPRGILLKRELNKESIILGIPEIH